MTWRRRSQRHGPDPGILRHRAERLVEEAQRAAEAQQAARESVQSVHAEAIRLRDSHVVAGELRKLIEENGWTERIALSMRLRERRSDQ